MSPAHSGRPARTSHRLAAVRRVRSELQILGDDERRRRGGERDEERRAWRWRNKAGRVYSGSSWHHAREEAVLAGVIAIVCFAASARPAEAARPCGACRKAARPGSTSPTAPSVLASLRAPGRDRGGLELLPAPAPRRRREDRLLGLLLEQPRRPAGPADHPEVARDWAHRIFLRAQASAACPRPWMALNELFGAHLPTPWTATNAQYRQNVIIFVRTLRELGARPMLLISSRPYTDGEAGLWWREAAHYADLVQEVYYSGKLIHRQGAIAGSRTMRGASGKRSAFTDLGILRRRSASCSASRLRTAGR